MIYTSIHQAILNLDILTYLHCLLFLIIGEFLNILLCIEIVHVYIPVLHADQYAGSLWGYRYPPVFYLLVGELDIPLLHQEPVYIKYQNRSQCLFYFLFVS